MRKDAGGEVDLAGGKADLAGGKADLAGGGVDLAGGGVDLAGGQQNDCVKTARWGIIQKHVVGSGSWLFGSVAPYRACVVST